MGRGIALVAATAGHRVYLNDAVPAAVQAALKQLRESLDRLVEKGRLTAEERERRMERIVPAERLEALAPAGLVIEAVVEEMEAKAALLQKVESIVDPSAILATNTSSLSVTAIGARLKRPDRFAGMHFFNPAPLMPLVEVVRGHGTSFETAQTVLETAKAWGKSPVLCKSTPGFIVNRVARPFYGEALRLLGEGAADHVTLDAVMRETGGFRMGPFELMDMIGHDVNFAVTGTVYGAFFHDARYRPSLIQKELVDAGCLGRKSGRGFYRYDDGAEKPAPRTAEAGMCPTRILVTGDLGPACALMDLAKAAGIEVEVKPGSGVIRIDDVVLALTDGRTATELTALRKEPVVVYDLALDYRLAQRIAVAPGDQVSERKLARALGFFQAIGKSVSILDDVPGLAVMRTVSMLVNEAADALHQGVATASDIDLAMVKGVNYPHGPLLWADRVGPAHILTVVENLGAIYGEDRYRPSPLLRRVAIAGRKFLADTGRDS